MNFKKNFKRFFTLSRNAEGFTLVELIVVIAILGILSVVAVPAYSQYVQKSQLGVDKSQLGVVNSLFVVSLVSNGKDPSQVETASLAWNGNKVTGLASLSFYSVTKSGSDASADSDVITKIMTEFATGLNGGMEFKIYTADKVSFVDGCFVGPDMEGSYSVGYGGGKINLNINDLGNLKDSSFITSEGLGTQELLNKVNEVTGFAAGLSGTNIMNGILSSSDFQSIAASAVGCTPAELSGKVDEMAEAMMKLPGNESMTKSEAIAQVQANAVVLFASQKALAMSKEQITSNLTAEGAGANLVSNLTKDPSGTMANAALAYGMYTAYAYSTGKQELIDNTKDYTNMGTYLEDDEFKAYVSSEQGQKDMDAYLSSLNMINASTGDKNAVTNLMVNGFNDPALAGLINQAMGIK